MKILEETQLFSLFADLQLRVDSDLYTKTGENMEKVYNYIKKSIIGIYEAGKAFLRQSFRCCACIVKAARQAK